jgi:glutamine amidotransferase
MIAIIDYGMGNIHSVAKAVELFGKEVVVTNEVKEISLADRAILPGVGAFQDALKELGTKKLTAVILGHIKKNKPFLGICLGMQLLFQGSEEAEGVKGLGVFKGTVKRFNASDRLKVPHIGWNQLRIKEKNCPLLKGLSDSAFVYFCHSYYPRPSHNEVVAATTNYGEDFASLVWRDNIFGAQFHPEKSQKTGLKIIENFVNL